MLAFLTPSWLAALDAAARTDQSLATASAEVHLVVQQRVTDTPDGDVIFHVVFDHGRVSVRPGPAATPTITFDQDYPTAHAIAAGTESAQRAFMTGKLRVGGDLRVLLEHQVSMAALEDVFAAVRADTDLGPLPAATPRGQTDLGAGTPAS